MDYSYRTRGTCAQRIDFSIDDEGKLHNVTFYGGCNGNLKAIGKLIEGQDAGKIADMLEGNTCGFKPTSCADQLSRAIRQIQQK